MGSFFENILDSDITGPVRERAKTKLKDGKIGQTLSKFGIDIKSADLGQMAKSVISVIGLAGKSVKGKDDEVEEEESVEETAAEGGITETEEE
ncbi:hypothetical protein C7120_04075 [Prevotella sp. oral taxon 376]|uniref:hypothetical protein n=1 Tax=Prevotella sp. oral taxon 376 TaxID=712466 RepID=UPI000D1E4B59|nr:hypothetical protein [Prevotella sp. oral taxon 376]PTL33777.1 hypothetical protein C7120_04075 [Prevotella sp. oral taxon 376]